MEPDDDPVWARLFAESKDVLLALTSEALADFESGKTWAIDEDFCVMEPDTLRQRLAALEAAVDAAEDDVAYSVAVAAVGRFLDETPLEAWERVGEEE